MNKQTYIEKHGYISNNDFKRALEKVKNYNIDIQDWKLPEHKCLSQEHINLMIHLRLHIKNNCHKNFKDNFDRFGVLPKHKGIYAVNYTGHCLNYNGYKFSGDYSFCIINKKLKFADISNENLYIINGNYPVYAITSTLEEDIQKVKNTNSSWWKDDVVPILITNYKHSQ